ncbi:uncharacterized protein FTOL_06359 [Fusarium torulosum]|uniref:Uncharacterized protein n=1 Tax=Fusarium torulosum TaxID=33205 RepID=A0AAE8M9A7_9HYPO|nr:uncharacterized protein FTOL_06359 [Fusarium torulosum]
MTRYLATARLLFETLQMQSCLNGINVL